jgi:hypothetical protein
LVPAISWKSLSHLLVAAERQEALLLERAQQHRLLVEAEFADLVEEQQPAVGRAQQPGRSCRAPVNAPLVWPNSVECAPSPRIVAQLTSTNGPAAGGAASSARRCAARAATCRPRSAPSAASAPSTPAPPVRPA